MNPADEFHALLARLDKVPAHLHAIARVSQPAKPEEMAAFDQQMRARLNCPLPESIKSILGLFDGAAVQSTVLYGSDRMTGQKPTHWFKKGIIYASETYLDDARDGDLMIIGESDLRLFAAAKTEAWALSMDRGDSRIRARYASVDDLVSEVLQEMCTSLDA